MNKHKVIKDTIPKIKKPSKEPKGNIITRIEVINHGNDDLNGVGRVYVKYLRPDEEIIQELQDDARTLKIFIKKK